ncbi:MAG: hypothetical protein FJ304_28060 [Planctomycetes bacterium]|nr:hypothetical protein [Planctomycetota bacterium]
MTIDRLLTLRVTFRDEPAAAEIAPEQAARYLTAHGWTGDDGPTIACYDRGTCTVMVPQHAHWADYGRRMCELVNELAEIEGRSALAVWKELVEA